MCQLCVNEGFEMNASARIELAAKIDVGAILDRVAANVYKGKKQSDADVRQLITNEYAAYREAIAEGAGDLAHGVELGTPNFEMLKNLQYNAGTFAGFKTRSQMRELVKELRDKDGNLRSFHEFMQNTKTLQENYNVHWARAEYDAAVRSSRMATIWQKVQETKDIYPNLKYIRSRSTNERVDHLKWVGTVLPIDHEFWKTHFPPNGWGCKCSVQATDEFYTEVPGGNPDEGFSFNPGLDGMVFDVNAHPYSQMPKKDRVEAARAARGALCSYERNYLVDFAKKNFVGKQVVVDGVPAPVGFVLKTFRKQLEYNQFFFEKLNILTNIIDVIKEAKYLFSEFKKERRDDAVLFHVLQVRFNGNDINLKVKQDKDGTCVLYYVHIQKK